MGIAAQLDEQPGVPGSRQVGGHDGDRPAKKRKWRGGHPLILERQQARNTAFACIEQRLDRIEVPSVCGQLAHFAAA